MKTSITKIASLLFLGAALSLQSCKKDDETKNTSTAPAGSAVITGKITADLILNNGQKEGVEGIVVTGTINTEDLVTNPVPGANYAQRTYTATTNSEGVYRLVIDANVKSVAVNFAVGASFEAEQTLENGEKRPMLFTISGAASSVIAVSKDQTVIKDVQYTFDENPTLGLAKVTGTALFRNDLCNPDPKAQTANVAQGTILIATWSDDEGRDREVEVKVGTDGKFELSVETEDAGLLITFKGRKFTGDHKDLDGGNCVTENDYEYTHTSVSVFATKNETTTAPDVIFE